MVTWIIVQRDFCIEKVAYMIGIDRQEVACEVARIAGLAKKVLPYKITALYKDHIQKALTNISPTTHL